jgi:hypothetical protein
LPDEVIDRGDPLVSSEIKMARLFLSSGKQDEETFPKGRSRS